MRVLLWHVHGSWTTAFVQGGHDYLVPVVPGRGPDGMGRAATYPWPDTVVELSPPQLAGAHIDVVVLQRPRDVLLARRWLGGRQLGRDVPAVWVEHDAPRAGVPFTRHPLADRSDIPLVHVTHFNRLMWDSGVAPTEVVEHGVLDPGPQWTGELCRAGVAVNEPLRRGRLVGTDLLAEFAAVAPVDLYGMAVMALPERLPGYDVTAYEDYPQQRMHAELSRRRVYLHPFRWTSLGLALVEAMHLGMPVVALATTEAVEAVPPEAGACSTRMDVLVAALRRFMADPDAAAAAGRAARAAAVHRYGLGRFLADWDRLLKEVTR
jgi:Glycosyl transferases group 1